MAEAVAKSRFTSSTTSNDHTSPVFDLDDDDSTAELCDEDGPPAAAILDQQRIYSAEQISIPPSLPRILKEYTKAVIRENPENVLEFSAKYFKEKAAEAKQKK